MKHPEVDALRGVIEEAREVYADDEDVLGILDGYDQRLREPLRLALAGMVKAGKSTLLNALIGEDVAPTDAGECTRTVTWYRHARSARITAQLLSGEKVRIPVKRNGGSLVIDLGARTAEEVDWIDVEWPSESLKGTVLIDTPGIASISEEVSARATRFLTPQDSPSGADAILYLLRHVHASDVQFLEAFHDNAAGAAKTVNAVALLSRADEIGSGRIDSLLSAARIADRYRRDGELRELALGCIPVAGLLAEGAKTLRETEFAAFRTLADLDRAVRDRLMISVDRFVRPTEGVPLSPRERSGLLARFGIFGVRLATTLVRAGAGTSSELSERLVQQSGLVEVQRFVAEQFRSRSSALKARAVLLGLESLFRAHRRPGSAGLAAGLERVTASSHDLRELSLLSALRASIPAFSPEDVAVAERIVGGSGTAALARLGLKDAATSEEIAAEVTDVLARFRAIAESPLSERATVEQCRTVVRSVEGVASELAASGRLGSLSDVVLATGPAQGHG